MPIFSVVHGTAPGQLGRYSGRYSAQKHGWQHPLGQIEAKTVADSDQEIGNYAWAWREKDPAMATSRNPFFLGRVWSMVLGFSGCFHPLT
jgi:hypothetical protein